MLAPHALGCSREPSFGAYQMSLALGEFGVRLRLQDDLRIHHLP
jgi:hypothetical protein